MYFLELKISKADSKFRASTNICDAQEKYYEILNIYLIVCNALAQSIYIFAKKFKASIMEPIVVSRKPCKCPKCGGKVVKIVYGMPTPELYEQAERKE